MLVGCLVTLVVLLVVHYYSKARKYLRLPSPGLPLPVIGHVYKLVTKTMQEDPVNGMVALYRKHQKNGMMWMRSFKIDLVFIGDFDTLNYLYNLPDMQGRIGPDFKPTVVHERNLKPGEELPGVLLSDGSTWAEQRRFTLRTLRDFGFGKSGMEEMISEEVELFLEEIRKSEGEPFNFANQFNLPIINALWTVCVGQRFDYNNSKLLILIKRMTEWFQRAAAPTALLVTAFPWLFKLFPTLFGYNETVKVQHDIIKMMSDIVKDHEETMDPNEPRDFTDKTLTEIKKTIKGDSSFHGDAGRQNLVHTLMDVFLAGSETTSTTLTWAVLYMARYPEVQAKVQEELDMVVGSGRLPSLQDKPLLPYTEAVVMEIQRYANIVPTGVNHTSHRDIEVNGQLIPAGALVLPLMAEILKGPYWGDGETFRPERFLDSEGKCRKDDHLIPFSIGKRQCLGETLAKAELFLFFTGIVHQFSIKPEVEGQLPAEDYVNGVTILPQPFQLRLHSRV